MTPFKFLTNNEERHPIPPPTVTMNDIAHAISVGRETYLNGGAIENNPYLTPEMNEAFDEGWDYEHSLDLLREARQRVNNETI